MVSMPHAVRLLTLLLNTLYRLRRRLSYLPIKIEGELDSRELL